MSDISDISDIDIAVTAPALHSQTGRNPTRLDERPWRLWLSLGPAPYMVPPA